MHVKVPGFAALPSEALLHSLQIGLLLVKQRNIVWANQSFYDLLGFGPGELDNRPTRQLFPSDADYAEIEALANLRFREGRNLATEMPLRHKNGEPVWCHITGNPIDPQDSSQGYIWSFANISDRVSAETLARRVKDDLAQTLARQEAILRSLQVGVVLLNNRRVIWGNKRYFDMLGYRPEELIGQNTRVYFFSDEEYEDISRYGYPLLREGKPFATELPIRRRDGERIWCHITGNAVNLDNLDEGYIWSFADITDRVEAEKRAREALEREQLMEAEKMAALGVVVAGVAHEINTPIGVNYTLVTHFRRKTEEFSELFRSGAMKRSDLQKYVELADETSMQLALNASRAANLIQSFKQISVDQTRDDRRLFNLREYLNEIVTSLTPQLRKARHEIAIDCPEDIEMHSYPGALSQIVTNLIMNSIIHAYDEGQAGRIRIAAYVRGALVQLDFSDDGKGIPPEHLPKIFDPFFTTRRGSGGSGLGLNIVFNLITRKLLGRIGCESQLGKGATFHLELPRMVESAAGGAA